MTKLITLLMTLAIFDPVSLKLSSQPFQVIVNASNPVVSVNWQFLADAFLKRITRWPDDKMIEPVDLSPESEARRKFSEGILKRSVYLIKNYWQQNIFSGHDVPPPELGTDAKVVEF